MLAAACSGGSGTTPSVGTAGGSASNQRVVDSGISHPRILRLMRIPNHPPPIKHHITAAMRARSRAGGWQPVAGVPTFTNGPQTMLLLTDGTVIIQDYCTPNWFKLTPSNTGSYTNGTWSQIAAMPSNYGPLYFASAVLADGKVIAQGGEYNGSSCSGVETNLGAMYDPVANKWTALTGPSGWSEIGDAQSAVLSDGTYMLGNCCQSVQALLNETSLTWTQIGTGKQDGNSEEGWTLLPNGSVLAADVGDAPNAQTYNPKSNMWVAAGQTPQNLTSGFEIGPQTLRPDGNVWVAGANGYSAVYNAKSGAWSAGPTFPVVNNQQLDVADGPSTMLNNGKVMVPASPGLYQSPASFYIYNGRKLTSIAGPPNEANDSSYNIRLLLLPTNQVLEDDGSGDIEIYSPGSGSNRYAPTIKSVPSTLTHGMTYKISGKLFNGMSQQNMYGDDVQQATNYPLVRITNNATGHVFYARTHDHSFMGVASMKTVSTMFDVPSGIETGASMIYVVTNGEQSNGVSVTIQ
ncbi:MAG TPA: hypothetical protein VEW74_02575 [Candidatus Nitrosotalea sp.]|nr:hypothetical protein [Candidatus Nitrosotalea sp.]